MRGRKCLVQIQMNYIDSHVSRTGDADQRVHIGSVHVDEPAGSMDGVAYFANVAFENADRVRIGQHEARDTAFVAKFSEVLHVGQSFGR